MRCAYYNFIGLKDNIIYQEISCVPFSIFGYPAFKKNAAIIYPHGMPKNKISLPQFKNTPVKYGCKF